MALTAASKRYRIIDEPSPSSLARVAVKPFWPLLASMLGGTWLAVPWFILNGFALGSPTRRREALLAALAVGGALALAMLVLSVDAHFHLGRRNAELALLAVTACDAEIRGLLTRAQLYVVQGNLDGAVEVLRELLASQPEHATAHALLSLCLHDLRRLHAAAYEAQVALALDPELPIAHHALALVRFAERRFDLAELETERLLALSGEDPDVHLLRARIYRMTGRRERTLPILEHALALDPERLSTKVALGDFHLERGNLEAAESMARGALEQQADHVGALRLMGEVLLQRGRLDEARDHAIWALRIRATDPGALHLLTAIKARRSPFLALWWRFNVWLSQLGEKGTVVVLLGSYLVYRAATIFLEGDAGENSVADLLHYGWLAFVLSTWLAPVWFAQLKKRELESVRLRHDF
jgi:tetratricopeptide (TPR) repeat protein